MIRRSISAALLFFVLTLAAFAGNKSAPAKAQAKVVDEGTFGVFQNGQRVATEKFIIRQYPDSSITTSEFRAENQNTGKIEQTSELILYPNGSLSRYEWKQAAPSHSSATVQPADQVLNMHVVADGKVSDQPFFLGPETFVLDDYFFSTREVLLWRYLASASCKPRPAGDGCDLERQRVPILIPRRRTSAQVFVEFKGYEDTPLNGRPQHLRHFVIQSDGPDWHLWLDPDHKLLRISIPDSATEILRQ